MSRLIALVLLVALVVAPAVAAPFAVPPTLLVFRDSSRRQGIIPLVMLHHLVYGGLTVGALFR